ncbi:MAG: hypothetical protein ABIR70_06195 [Bryobacteraceae bacterium]
MRTILYRRWAPNKSSVKVEFPPDIIHDIRAQSPGEHDRGYLFGRRESNEVRISTAIRTPEAGDPRIAGTEPVGIYITRARGEVFLTDADLEQVDRLSGGIALVIAGGRAGFFAREADGSMQAVRSHEEFLVAEAATQADPQLTRRKSQTSRPNLWKWAFGFTGLLAGPVAALAYLQPMLPPPPIELSLHETQGQLVIQWDPKAATSPDAFLEITEAEGRTVLPVAPGSSSATYAARSGDVEILLSTSTRSGRIHWTSARFVPPVVVAPVTEFRSPEEIEEDMVQLQSQAAYLRQAIARRQAKVQQLSAEADRLLGPVQ